MKVSKEHYGFIKQQMIDGVYHLVTLNNMSVGDWFDAIESKYADYTETRKLWDFYWGTGGNDWQYLAFNDDKRALSSRWTISASDWVIVKFGFDCYARNDAGYNDDHLTTAIKKAYYELKGE